MKPQLIAPNGNEGKLLQLRPVEYSIHCGFLFTKQLKCFSATPFTLLDILVLQCPRETGISISTVLKITLKTGVKVLKIRSIQQTTTRTYSKLLQLSLHV